MMRHTSLAAGALFLAGCLAVDGPFEVLDHDFERGGQTADGVFFTEHVPGVQVRAQRTAPLRDTEVDLARALDAATGRCGEGRVWVPDETYGSPFFFEGIWYLPGSCGAA